MAAKIPARFTNEDVAPGAMKSRLSAASFGERRRGVRANEPLIVRRLENRSPLPHHLNLPK